LIETSFAWPASASKHFLPRRAIDVEAGLAIFSFGSFSFSSKAGRKLTTATLRWAWVFDGADAGRWGMKNGKKLVKVD
jgi:hypothetical protein